MNESSASARRLALIVATDQYRHDELDQLAGTMADARELAATLADPTLGGFRVDTVLNSPSYEAGPKIEAVLSECSPDDLVWLHFSCHGLKDDSGELFLATTNTLPNRLSTTSIEAALISRLMRRSPARRVVVTLDCCYGGAFERGLIPRAGQTVDVADQFTRAGIPPGRGRVVITASSAMEYAFEGGRLADGTTSPSFFTGAIVEGIRTGSADRDEDGYVELGELYDYVHSQVLERTPYQTPSKWEFGLEGDLYVARNPHLRVRASALPSELDELMTHRLSEVRAQAVAWLADLAVGRNLGVAAAAREALIGLQNDDSRAVSGGASRALESCTLALPSDHVHLGQAFNGQAATGEVAIQGGPLARACQVSTSTPWLQATIRGDLLRLRLESDSEGPRQGEVTLSGPAGSATTRVSADFRSPLPQRPNRPSDIGTPSPPPPESTAASPKPTTAVFTRLRRLAARLSRAMTGASTTESPVLPTTPRDPDQLSRPRRGKRLLLGLSVVALVAAVLVAWVVVKASSSTTDGVGPGGLAAAGINLAGQTYTVGGKDFDEQLFLCKAQIAAMRSVGATVNDRCGIQGSAAARAALISGQIDMYWSYTGTGWITDLKQTQVIKDPMQQYIAVRDLDLQQNNIVWTNPTPFNNTYGIATTKVIAAQNKLSTLSDWAKFVNSGNPNATLCVEPEFAGRDDGLPSLLRTYGVTKPYTSPPAVTTLDTGVVYQATATGNPCKFGEVFTTDGRIPGLNLTTLTDDKNFFPIYNASNTIRGDVANRNPDVIRVSNEIARRLDNTTMLSLNGQISSQGQDPAQVANVWLKQQGLIS